MITITWMKAFIRHRHDNSMNRNDIAPALILRARPR